MGTGMGSEAEQNESAPSAPPGGSVLPDVEALNGQEVRFRALFADGPAAQAFTDMSGRMTAANRAYLRLLGLEAPDLMGKSLMDFTHPEDRGHNARLLEDLVAGRIGSFQIAKRYLHSDGHVVPVLNTVAIVEAGGERFVAAVSLPRPTSLQDEGSANCEHEPLWRAGFHDTSLPQAHVDRTGTIPDVNAAMCHLVGLSTNEVIGRTSADLTHAADSGDSDRALGRLLSGQGRAATSERLLRHASGRPIPALVFSNVVVVQGKVVGSSAYFQDLRVVHDAQRRLEQQSLMFAALGERSRDVGVVADADGTLVYVSPAAVRMFGYQPAEVIGRPAWDFLHPDDVSGYKADLEGLVAAGGGTRARTLRLLTGDERTRWVSLTMTNLLHTPVGGIVGNVVDVTEQRSIEEQFRLEQQRNRAIVDNLQEGVWVTDADAHTVFANAAMAEILGLPLTAVYDAPATALFPREETDLVAERIRTRVVRGPERYQLTYAHPDGTTHHLAVAAVPLAFGDEPIAGSLATVNDVTAARAMERELREANAARPVDRAAEPRAAHGPARSRPATRR